MNKNQPTQDFKHDDLEQFRDVAVEGWEQGKADFLAGRRMAFHDPLTYYEKAYCYGYMEMKHAENVENFREIANDGFELGEADCRGGKELFFVDPQTYFEKGYFLGFTLTKQRMTQSGTAHPEI